MTIASHTLVKNGMPFIVPVLESVYPFVHRMLITMSVKADNKTSHAVGKFVKEHGDKAKLYFEDVPTPGMLTQERQKLLDKTYEDWVLFLDDDDMWPEKSLKEISKYLDSDVDGLAFAPYQVVDEKYYDGSWSNRWFTKFFRKKEGTHYRYPWPKDLIFIGDDMLYWKKNPRVPRVPVEFFHLSYIKDHSFRSEEWAGRYKFQKSKLVEYPKEVHGEVRRIFSIRNK